MAEKEAKKEEKKTKEDRKAKEEKRETQKAVKKMKGFSGAEIKAVCTEAGYYAIREGRKEIWTKDFLDAAKKVREKGMYQDITFMKMFG